MYKKTVTYEDLFSGREITEAHYFHVSKTRLMRNMDIKDDLESFQNRIEGDERELTTAEKKEILELIERLVKISWGYRTEDGRFSQSALAYEAFVESPAYDAIIFSIFESNTSAVEFFTGILPKDLQADAQKALDSETQEAMGAAIPPARPKVPLDHLQRGEISTSE